MIAIKNIANSAFITKAGAIFGLIFLVGCSALPTPPTASALYDFGPSPVQAAPADVRPTLPPLALAPVEATGTPDGSTALYYRLAYANAQQLRPYAQARWSQPPAQLLQQRLRDHLGQRRAVLMAADAAVAPASDATTSPQRTTILRAELEEFSHVFTSPDASAGLLRLRATLVRPHLRGEQLLGQRVFVVQIPAPSPDARGAAIALALGASQVADELAQWVDGLGKP